MVNTDEFSKRLQKIFDYYDLNASAFADKIDVGRATISHLLSGRNKPSLDFVMRVVKTFPEVELYWLLNGKGSFPKSNSSTPTSVTSKEDFNEVAKTIPHTTPQNISQQDHLTNKMSKESSTTTDIERIVIFYKNGVFKTYTPE